MLHPASTSQSCSWKPGGAYVLVNRYNFSFYLTSDYSYRTVLIAAENVHVPTCHPSWCDSWYCTSLEQFLYFSKLSSEHRRLQIEMRLFTFGLKQSRGRLKTSPCHVLSPSCNIWSDIVCICCILCLIDCFLSRCCIVKERKGETECVECLLVYVRHCSYLLERKGMEERPDGEEAGHCVCVWGGGFLLFLQIAEIQRRGITLSQGLRAAISSVRVCVFQTQRGWWCTLKHGAGGPGAWKHV